MKTKRLSICTIFLLPIATASLSSELDEYIDANTIELVEGYDKRIRFAPSTVEVMESRDLLMSGALNLGEVLDHVVGIEVTRSTTTASSDTVVRGIDGNWLILYNGVEIDRLLPDFFSIPIADIQRLEVLKGSHFAVYGPSAIVGTINIVTFDPSENETNLSIRTGALDTHEAWVRKSQQFSDGGFSAFLYHSSTSGDDRIISDDRQSEFDTVIGTEASFAPAAGSFDRELTMARLTLELGKYWTINQYMSRRRAGLGTGLVQALDPVGEESLDRSATNFQYNRETDFATFDVQATYTRETASYDDVYLFPPGTLGGLFPDGVIQSYGQTGEEITLNATVRKKIARHTLELGIGMRHGKADNDYDRRNYLIQEGSTFPYPVGSVQEFIDSEPLFAKQFSTRTQSVVLRDRLFLDADVTLDLGVRVDNSEGYGTVLNPRIGLEWILGRFTDLILLYGESSILPTVIQQTSNGLFAPLGDESLTPAKMRMVEVAINTMATRAIKFKSSAFYYRQEDDIATIADETSPNGAGFANLNGSQSGHGVELSLDFAGNPRWSGKLGLAYQNGSFSENTASTAATWLGFAETRFLADSGWQAQINFKGAFGRERSEDDTRDQINDYLITNLSVMSPSFNQQTVFTFSIQNIFDQEAKSDVSSAIENDVPIWPQRVLLGFRHTF